MGTGSAATASQWWRAATSATHAGATPQGELWPWQSAALEAWRSAGRSGVIEAVTGTGKSRIGVEAAKEAVSDGGNVLLLVPTTALLRQWAAHFDDHLPHIATGLLGGGHRADFGRVQILIATVHSAAGMRHRTGTGPHLLIADECHRYGSPTFATALHPAFPRRLGLTATFERSDDGIADVLEPYFGAVVHRYGLDEAVRDGVIAPYRIAFVGVDLAPSERMDYDDQVERASKARGKLIARYGLPAQPFGAFLLAANRAAGGAPFSPLTRTARGYLGAFSRYRAILAETDAKLSVLPALSDFIASANGTLVFGESIAACRAIAQLLRDCGLAAAALHSELGQDEREALLERFRKREITALSAPRILDEGIDVPEADLAIVVAASSSRRQMLQRMGRVLRRKSDGRHASLVILFVRNTPEDVDQGGHEAFIDVALGAAEDWRRFDAADPLIGTFLSKAPAARAKDSEAASPMPWWDLWETNLGDVTRVQAGREQPRPTWMHAMR